MTAPTVIRGIISLTYLLVISPYLLGSLLSYKLEGGLMDSGVLRYITGFFSQLGLWGVFSLADIYIGSNRWPLHILYLLFSLVLISISSVSIVLKVRNIPRISDFFSGINGYVRDYAPPNLFFGVILILTMVIIVFQLFMVFLCARDAYDDTGVYTAIMTKALSFDHPSWGEAIKHDLAPWILYMTCISYISGQHPMFINGTLIPAICLVLFYLMVYLLGRFIFADKIKGVYLFCFVWTVSVSVIGYATYGNEYSLTHSVAWGKTVMGGVAVPIIVLLYNLAICRAIEMDQYDVSVGFLLFLFGAGCAWLSIMAILILALGLFSMTITALIRTKRIWTIVYGMAGGAGVMIQAILYMLYHGIGLV